MTREEIVNRIVELSAIITACSDPDCEACDIDRLERRDLKTWLGQIDADAAERRRDIADAWKEARLNHDGDQYETY